MPGMRDPRAAALPPDLLELVKNNPILALIGLGGETPELPMPGAMVGQVLGGRAKMTGEALRNPWLRQVATSEKDLPQKTVKAMSRVAPEKMRQEDNYLQHMLQRLLGKP